jgi:EmrB/QacA subfamily drug resistance transporter
MPETRTGVRTGAASPTVSAADNRWLVLAIVSLAQFMVVLDTTIVNVALPSIQRGLHFAATDLQWIINSYLLFFGGFLLLGGRAGDLIGRKRLFVAGVVTFAVASAINGIAPSSGWLVAGRALQGLGGAMLSPAALSILNTTFTDSRERTRALGVWSAIAAGSGAIGLLLGGVLTDALSWRWIFFINLPVALLAVVAAVRFVPESRAELRQRSFDLAGAVTVTGGLVLLVYTLVNAQAWGWGSARTVGLFAASAVLLAGFVLIEARSRLPLVQLGIFRIRTLAVANVAMFVTASGLFASFYFTSLYVQEVLGYSPTRSGVALLPLAAGIIVGAGLSQQLMQRGAIRFAGPLGLAMATAGMLLFARFPVNGSYATDLLPALIVWSVGMGLAFVPLTLLATSGVKSGDAGLASGLFNTMSQVGGALGLAILATIATSRTEGILAGAHGITAYTQLSALVSGYHIAYFAGAVVSAVGAIVLAAFLRQRDIAGVDLGIPAQDIPIEEAA